jgi:hypothetical protein
VLIKKKDVESYFAARRARHPLSPKQANPLAATKSSKVKHDSKTTSLAAAIEVPASSAGTADSHVSAFTSERGFIDAPPPVVTRWAKT